MAVSGRNNFLLTMTATALTALAACGTAQPPPKSQDIEFVRGCWSLRAPPDGPVEMMLRLLPESAEGTTYRGIVREFAVNQAGDDNYEFIFSRDGSWLEMDNHAPDSVRRLSTSPRPRLLAAEPPPDSVRQFGPGDHLAAFRFEDGDWVIAGSKGESLILYLVHSDGKAGETYFAGDRDGCD